ncbi:hypothetical protein ACV56Z_01420 [Staphylococcus aureus]
MNEDNDFVGVCSRKDLLRASMIGADIHTVPIVECKYDTYA